MKLVFGWLNTKQIKAKRFFRFIKRKRKRRKEKNFRVKTKQIKTNPLVFDK